jgi:hypothetical protein
MGKLARFTIGVAGLVGISAGTAFAADLPLKAPPRAAVVYTGGFYIWADGSYQSIPLPTYDLGFFTGVGNNITAVERHRPRVTGFGVDGGIGYVLPQGTLSPLFGADARIEASAHYVNARSTENGSAFLPIPVGAQLANGSLPFGVGCNAASPCTTASTLRSEYSAWRLELKGASDFKTGALTLTPSVAVFGGTARTDQTYTQIFSLLNPPVSPFNTYRANSNLDWADIGIKAGLQASFAVTNTVTVAAGGTIGTASRLVDLSISDAYVPAVGALGGASTLGTSADANPFLANAEASLYWKPSPLWSARLFGGVNYDSKVPGIVRPNIIGGNLVPASIGYEALTSWYVGGGAGVKLGM